MTSDADDIEFYMHKVDKRRDMAEKVSKKETTRMIKKNIGKYPPSRYMVGERAFLKAKKPTDINRGGNKFGAPPVSKGKGRQSTRPVGTSQVPKRQNVNLTQHTQQFLEMLYDIPSMTREDIINNMDVLVDGFYTTITHLTRV